METPELNQLFDIPIDIYGPQFMGLYRDQLKQALMGAEELVLPPNIVLIAINTIKRQTKKNMGGKPVHPLLTILDCYLPLHKSREKRILPPLTLVKHLSESFLTLKMIRERKIGEILNFWDSILFYDKIPINLPL